MTGFRRNYGTQHKNARKLKHLSDKEYHINISLMVLSKAFEILNHFLFLANTVQKIKFSIKDFFSKCDQICSFLRTWSHLLKKFLVENFIFCAVTVKRVSLIVTNPIHSCLYQRM